MRASVINQFAGTNTAASTIRGLLANTRYDRLRLLLAFCRGGGVGLLAGDLQAFIERGGSLESVVGLDLNGTSPDALEALCTYGDCFVFGVRGDRTFHPKVAIFDGSQPGTRSVGVLMGSSNWTAGGLDSNFESSVLLEAAVGRSRHEDAFVDEVDDLWTTYRTPVAPMVADHLQRVTSSSVHAIASRLAREGIRPPDSRSGAISDDLFPPIIAPRAGGVRARRRSATGRSSTPIRGGLPRTLLLDVPGPETGLGREIQLPLDILQEFFDVVRGDTYYMDFHHADGTREVNRPLAMYGNSTFRISSSAFQAVPTSKRPMVVRLDREARNVFRVETFHRGTPGYRRHEPLLDRGGSRSKRWGLVD